MNDLAELLRESVQLFEPIAASKQMSLKITGNSDSICADFDHDKILQVVSNLVGNALKFSPKGSTITLSAERKKAEVEVRVTDDGPGIPNEKQTEIFERFSQLKVNDRRGLGLGLFISKWIVEAHKGRIWVCSEIGKGSTFTFSLPSPVSH
jgi:signal transduction histidine kinase